MYVIVVWIFTSCLKGFPLQWGSTYGVLEAVIQLSFWQPLSVVCLWQSCLMQPRRSSLVIGHHNITTETPPKYLFSSMSPIYARPLQRFSCWYSYLGIYGPSSCPRMAPPLNLYLRWRHSLTFCSPHPLHLFSHLCIWSIKGGQKYP